MLDNMDTEELELRIRPIGYIRTGKAEKFHARHQPLETESEENVLELVEGAGMREAIHDLGGFTRIWLVWWFHRNPGWRPLVLPPRGPAKRRGVFATRSPHRPNALGLTAVRLLGVKPGKLLLGPCDLVEGTPVFDIKQYIPAYDSFPEERVGWMDEVDAAMQQPPAYVVQWGGLAEEQGRWLAEEWGVDFRPRMAELLGRDPSPHRTRRIGRRGERFEIGCGAWRGLFRVEGAIVTVEELQAGYPRRFLNDPARPVLPDREAQLAFLVRWPECGVEGA